MATRTKKDTTSTTRVNTWQEELAKEAQVAMGQEQNAAGGQFFSLASGQLSFGGSALPNNEMACVLLDGIMENVMYVGKYDPANPCPPVCFAFGRDEKEMKPHEIASKPQSIACANCPKNAWASADTGKGKACRNTRRLAIIPAGSLMNGRFQAIEDAEHYEEAKIGYLKLPVTSVKAYAGFVKQVGSALNRPPFGVFTRVKVVPDVKTQFRVVFEVLSEVPNAIMETIFKRAKEAREEIAFPYQPMAEAAPVKAPAGPKRKSKY